MGGLTPQISEYSYLSFDRKPARYPTSLTLDTQQTHILLSLFLKQSKKLVAEENVRAVVTMNEEYETRFLCCSAQEWEAMGVEQLRLSTVDLTGVPALENLHKGVEFILKHRASGNSVYVHCKAGRSRSATMVAAYLIQLHHWSPQEAIEAIAKIRPHILIRHKQVQVLETFHRNMITGTTA
ncbi:PREDICTED: phosphatidylglycerophosphatase and protein-tyrosine phosphatase 1 [Chaetura pelagica]|uniref:phosphatidylglycerophosphatase and protein-tyrosine phosphatase 1 n=1 Tax=Chaetura pelagica TaxID=8897 RepID=UPI0005233D93|nr:PREDICTED: phosphatidylglycerophosphatase and protein-tyrosine phosphatase 1 [Chaetura pelagica]